MCPVTMLTDFVSFILLFRTFTRNAWEHDLFVELSWNLLMERREREIEEMETRMNRERQERATLVEAAEYCRPVISIPDKIMDLGNYFFQIKG